MSSVSPPPPFLYSTLTNSRSLSGAGIIGWSISSVDEGLLQKSVSSNIETTDRVLATFRSLFGFSLDWRQFPVVRVADVAQGGSSEGGNPLLAQQSNLQKGDMLLAKVPKPRS
ncbi:unnamed protein product, partial [Amoebophrya sp. A25]|eukprot:GSA25T00012918001.1